MRTRQRIKHNAWYALYQGEQPILDEDGYDTGEKQVTYSTPQEMRLNVSTATGQTNTEMFGNLADYDRVLLTDDTSLLIDENSILWVDTTPPENAGNNAQGYDYIVKRVAKTYNYLAIAIQKVKVDAS